MLEDQIEEREVRWNLVSEDWSRYEILGGAAEVWVRAILLKLHLAEGPDGLLAARAETANQVATFFPESMKRIELGDDETEPEPDQSDQVDFEPIHEPWNVYRTEGEPAHQVRTKVVVTNIAVDPQASGLSGDPVVHVMSQTVVSSPHELSDTMTA